MCVDIINIKGFRSSRAQMFFKTALIKNFAIFLGKHLCWSLIYFVFSSEYCKILKASFFYRTSQWLLLTLWFLYWFLSIVLSYHAKKLKKSRFCCRSSIDMQTSSTLQITLKTITVSIIKIDFMMSRDIFHRKRCSENMQEIYRRIPMPKCDFNKVALQLS